MLFDMDLLEKLKNHRKSTCSSDVLLYISKSCFSDKCSPDKNHNFLGVMLSLILITHTENVVAVIIYRSIAM